MLVIDAWWNGTGQLAMLAEYEECARGSVQVEKLGGRTFVVRYSTSYIAVMLWHCT